MFAIVALACFMGTSSDLQGSPQQLLQQPPPTHPIVIKKGGLGNGAGSRKLNQIQLYKEPQPPSLVQR